MKRAGGGPMSQAAKRPRGPPQPSRFEARVLIPSKAAGSVIGKGGANIQKLRADHGAGVRIPDCPGPERVMSVQADSVEKAVGVLRDGLAFLADDAHSDHLELRLLVHQSIVGGVIGRAGFKIKEIRENSGAAVKVYGTCAPQSTDRCVSVGGTAEKVVSAAREVLDIVAATEPKGPEEPYDPINFDQFYAGEYGGYGDIDEGGGGVGGNRPPPPPMDRRGGGGGPPHDGRRGGGGGGFRPDSRGFGGRDFAPQPPPPQQHRNNFGGGGGGGFRDSFAADEGGEQETNQVTIPKEMAGAIIGPGGSRIRKIRADSRCTITIDEPAPGSNERIITIVGGRTQIQTAQYLLQQSVRENAPQAAGYY